MSEIPPVWHESFGNFSDNSLHLLARLYLNDRDLKKNHSRELIIETLWHHANREEFNRQSLAKLDSLDIKILLLLYLGLHSIRQLAASLSDCNPIEICLQLLNLQERLLVLQRESKDESREKRHLPLYLIPKIEKQLQGPEGASFCIAPQFMAQLPQRLDFGHLFGGRKTRAPNPAEAPNLLLNSELLLASALFFAREAFLFKRKISKFQFAKCQDCFPQLDEEQLQQLQQLNRDYGLLGEGEQRQAVFSLEAFKRLWESPYYQRLLSLQANMAGMSATAFAKLLSIWPRDIMLPGPQLQQLLALLGIPYAKTAAHIQTMLLWNILLESSKNKNSKTTATEHSGKIKRTEPLPHYLLNPRIYDSITGKEEHTKHTNRLSSNWEFYCDLRHPENYIDLLLCANLERFSQLSLFHIEKSLFQRHFNAESDKFENFLQHIPKLERSGIHIADFVRQQWQEWFNDSMRFQLFKNCLLVCPPSYSELIVRLLEPAEGQTSNIRCNPQPGIFYLNEEHCQLWRDKLMNADIQMSEPFTTTACTVQQPIFDNWQFPLESALSQKPKNPIAMPSLNLGPLSQQDFPWQNWPTDKKSFVNSRQLVCSNTNWHQVHIHFREARGVDYTAKRNLLHSLLTARNHMAVITVAEGDDFDLVPYMVLPLKLNGSKDTPTLLALDLRQECLLQFRVKNITRVNEIFYSMIDICLLGLLPCDYIFALEEKFQLSQTAS